MGWCRCSNCFRLYLAFGRANCCQELAKHQQTMCIMLHTLRIQTNCVQCAPYTIIYTERGRESCNCLIDFMLFITIIYRISSCWQYSQFCKLIYEITAVFKSLRTIAFTRKAPLTQPILSQSFIHRLNENFNKCTHQIPLLIFKRR